MKIFPDFTSEIPVDDGPKYRIPYSIWTVDSRPWMGNLSIMIFGGLLLLAIRAACLRVVFQEALRDSTDPYRAAFVMLICILPMTILEILTVVHCYKLGALYRHGQLLGTRAWHSADRICRLIYATFFAGAIGLMGAGYFLDMGIAVAAPLLAPMAPMMLGAGAIRLLCRAITDGAGLRGEVEKAV